MAFSSTPVIYHIASEFSSELCDCCWIFDWLPLNNTTYEISLNHTRFYDGKLKHLKDGSSMHWDGLMEIWKIFQWLCSGNSKPLRNHLDIW